ncbi:hypothetical protein [Microbacterium sp. MMO-56]|uniref:hypothetical protein n=1 Tax=Microbacterium sp. MMO-56 TaxID=3081281 RepID=UPI00301A494E
MRVESKLRPSARDLAGPLVERMLASRPVIGTRVTVPPGAKPDSKGVIRTSTVPIYGAPEFRNVINTKGEHV